MVEIGVGCAIAFKCERQLAQAYNENVQSSSAKSSIQPYAHDIYSDHF